MSAGNGPIGSHGSLAQCLPTLVRSDSIGGPSLTTMRPKATVATGAGLADTERAPTDGAWWLADANQPTKSGRLEAVRRLHGPRAKILNWNYTLFENFTLSVF